MKCAVYRSILLLGVVFLTLGVGVKEIEKIEIFDAKTGRLEKVEPVVRTDAQWRKLLTPEQYQVTRLKGTERPFSGQCSIPKSGKSPESAQDQGIYQCVGCGTDLFGVEKKFESGTGWPSFWNPVSPFNIRLESDTSYGMRRQEVLCARCGSHLGHVFDDGRHKLSNGRASPQAGPPPTGKRYCINSVALRLKEFAAPGENLQTAIFAGGCFWGFEKVFVDLPGVVSTRVGYAGGKRKGPSYEEVCTGLTGHAEAVEIVYDPAKIRYEDLLEVFWTQHDPTTTDRQGPDIGTQYRSVIFYHTPEQKKAAERSKEALDQTHVFKDSIVTQIVPAGEFYPAEEYHQKYLKKNPQGYCSIQPQPARVREVLRKLR